MEEKKIGTEGLETCGLQANNELVEACFSFSDSNQRSLKEKPIRRERIPDYF